jgi:hypothetical protein
VEIRSVGGKETLAGSILGAAGIQPCESYATVAILDRATFPVKTIESDNPDDVDVQLKEFGHDAVVGVLRVVLTHRTVVPTDN